MNAGATHMEFFDLTIIYCQFPIAVTEIQTELIRFSTANLSYIVLQDKLCKLPFKNYNDQHVKILIN